MANTTAYFVAAIGLAVSVAAFYAGKNQREVIVVPGQQTIYVRDQHELEKEEKETKQRDLLNQKRRAKEQADLLAPAKSIALAITQYAHAHPNHKYYILPKPQNAVLILPTQAEVEAGCLNAYQPGGRIALAYLQQKRLQFVYGNDEKLMGDSPGSEDFAFVFVKGGRIAISSFGDIAWRPTY